MKRPNLHGSTGKRPRPKGEPRDLVVIGEVHHIARYNRKKILYLLCFQKPEPAGGRKAELRLGYYTMRRKSAVTNKWNKWLLARYEVTVDAMDLRAIISKAEQKGWL